MSLAAIRTAGLALSLASAFAASAAGATCWAQRQDRIVPVTCPPGLSPDSDWKLVGTNWVKLGDHPPPAKKPDPRATDTILEHVPQGCAANPRLCTTAAQPHR